MDIGSNDGITLDTYEKNKFQLLGIEPSSAAKVAQKKELKQKKIFLPIIFLKDYLKNMVRQKLLQRTNVFAHIENIRDFTKVLKIS